MEPLGDQGRLRTYAVAASRAISIAFAAAVLYPVDSAHAQQAQVSESILLDPWLPVGFEAFEVQPGIQQQQRDWAALGISVSGFTLYPQLTLGQSITNNAYSTQADKVASAIETVAPQIDARSNWSRHSLRLLGAATLQRYVGEPQRNEDEWTLYATSEIDVTSNVQVSFEARADQIALNRLTDDVIDIAAAVLIQRQDMLSASAMYRAGRARTILTGEYFDIRYKKTVLSNGNEIDQSDRDHSIHRISGQFEYSFSPDFTIFTQALYSDYAFDPSVPPNISNASFASGRLIAGARAAIPGLGRATVSVGYAKRDYDRPSLRDVDGVSGEARLEVFPSALTTVTLDLGHRLAEARLMDSALIKSDYARLRVDHALLRNLVLTLDGGQTLQQYTNSSSKSRVRSARFSARYLASRRFELSGTLSYSGRHSPQRTANSNVAEVVGGIAATFKL